LGKNFYYSLPICGFIACIKLLQNEADTISSRAGHVSIQISRGFSMEMCTFLKQKLDSQNYWTATRTQENRQDILPYFQLQHKEN